MPRLWIWLGALAGGPLLGQDSPTVTPDREFTFRVVSDNGRPVLGYRVFGIESDRGGLVRWRPGPEVLAGARLQVVGQDGGPPTFGMLPPGAHVLDLHASDPRAEPIELRRPPAGALHLVGQRAGEPEALDRVSVQWATPFDGNRTWRSFYDAGAELRVDDVPLGVPVWIVMPTGPREPVILRSVEPRRIELEVPAPEPRLRYRPVDAAGNVLALRHMHGGPVTLEKGMVVVRRQRGMPRVIARFVDVHGEEWSCPPFDLPDEPWQGMRDAGDLVLTASSRSVFCSGKVVDAAGRPVAASVWLGDRHAAWAGAESDAEGRFRILIGPWLEGPMTLFLPHYGRTLTAPVQRGRSDVVVVVGDKGPVDPYCEGQLLGLIDLPVWPQLLLHVRAIGRPRPSMTVPIQRAGSLGFSLPVGDYEVTVAQGHDPDAAVLARIEQFALTEHNRTEPARLELALPEHLRLRTVRFVDTQGDPFPPPGITTDPSATVQVLVANDGAEVAFEPILQRVEINGDCEVVLDPVVVEVEVAELPRASDWIFGLAVRLPDTAGHVRTHALVAGRGRMFVPRGRPLQIELHATKFGERGTPVPIPWGPQPPLSGFGGRVVVPADGEPGAVKLTAPKDLGQQLAKLAEAATGR